MSNPNVWKSPSGSGAHALEHRSNGSDPLPPVLYPAVTLVDAATISTNAALGTHFRVTLEGNRALANPSNLQDTQRLTWEIIQDPTGGRTLSYGSMFTFGSDIPSPTLSVVGNRRDFITAIYNEDTNKLYVVGFARGY